MVKFKYFQTSPYVYHEERTYFQNFSDNAWTVNISDTSQVFQALLQGPHGHGEFLRCKPPTWSIVPRRGLRGGFVFLGLVKYTIYTWDTWRIKGTYSPGLPLSKLDDPPSNLSDSLPFDSDVGLSEKYHHHYPILIPIFSHYMSIITIRDKIPYWDSSSLSSVFPIIFFPSLLFSRLSHCKVVPHS